MGLIQRSIQVLRTDGVYTLFKRITRFVARKLNLFLPLLMLIKISLALIPRNEDLWVLGDGHRGRERRGENAKYFFLQLANNKDKDIIWISHREEEIDTFRDNGYTAYNSRSWRGRYTLLRANKIFCTNGMDFTWWLTGKSDIVQLWHGNALKKGGWDVVKHRNYSKTQKRYRKHITYNWDWFITTSRNPPADIQRRAFSMSEKDTLITGYPRTDVFFKDIDHLGIDVDTSLLSHLDSLSSNETVFMYAPTWRRDYRGTDKTVLNEADLNLSQLDSKLEENDSYLVLKIHPMEDVKVDQKEFNRILVAEPGSDPYPLLKRVDCLIADYSSIFVDYLLLNRPIIFFPYDLEEYTANEGLYYKYEAITPGDVVKSDRELYDSMERIAEDNDPYETEREVIRDLFYDHIDGNSAERIYQRVDSTTDR